MTTFMFGGGTDQGQRAKESNYALVVDPPSPIYLTDNETKASKKPDPKSG